MSSMWNSVKKYFSRSDSAAGSYKGGLYQERESDHEMMMECDQNFHTKTTSAESDEEKRCGIQNYFDDDYLDLIIDEREDGPEDDYKDFNKLVEKAGIADLKNESVHNKDIDNTVRDSTVCSYRHKATVVDGSESESEENSEHDMSNESEKDDVSDMEDKSIKSKEGEESVNDSSTRISDKNAHVAESKSISFMETEETNSYQDFQSYEDKMEDFSSPDTRKYYSDILPDVSSDELSEDEPLDKVSKGSEELPGDIAATKGIKAIDSSSAASDMLNPDDKNPEVTIGLHGTLSSPVTNFELENKPVQLSKEELPSWKQRGRNMPELDVMNELPQQLTLDSLPSRSMAEDKKNRENNQHTVINKFITPTKNMPELDNGIDVGVKLCDETSSLVSSNGIVEGTKKEIRGSVNSLSENGQGDKKDISRELKEEDHFISFPSLQKDAFYHHRKMKEAEICFAEESSLKKNDMNEESPKSSALGNKPFVLDEGKEERAFQNSSSTGLENYRELSPLRKAVMKSKSTFLPISNTTLKLDGSSDMRIQGGSNESPISHTLTEINESRNEHGAVESNNSLDKEQNSTIKNKILTEKTPEVNTGSDSVNNHDGRTVNLKKNIFVTDVRNESEAKSVEKLCEQSISEELKHDEVRNTYESCSQGNTEAKLDSVTISTMPKLDIEVENTPRNSNHQNEELNNMCNGTNIQNHSQLEQDFCHSSRKMLTQRSPPGRSSIGAVEIKMDNGILRLSVTPSGLEEGYHVNGREMTNSKAIDNCSLVSKEETGTQTITGMELSRNQSQKNAEYFQQKSGKSAEPGILSDWFSASTTELGIQTIAVRDSSMVCNLGKNADSQQMPIRTIEKDKAEVEITMDRRKEPCRRVDDLRLASEITPKSSFSSINPLISVAEVGTQVNEDWSHGSHSISDKSLVMKAEATTQTSITESSRGQNAITISDLQQVLEKIFGASHQPKLFPSSKANVETQTTVPNYLYPSSSQDNPEMASCSMSPARFHIKSSNLCMLEGSNDRLDCRSHCKCSTHVPYPLNSSSPASTSCSSSSQYNSTPSRGPSQIKKLLDVSRHARLEFNPVSLQTQKTVAKNLSKMMNHNESAVECKGNCHDFCKSAKITASSPQRIPSPYVNLATPTSNGGPRANQATLLKTTHSGGKSSRKRTGQNFHDSNGCLNLENNSRDFPGPSGVNVTASPKKVSSSQNPLIFICCSCRAPGISVQGRELVIIQRSNTANPMLESAKGNTLTTNERVSDVAKPVVKQHLDTPLKQNSVKVFQTDAFSSKTVSENNSDSKTTAGSQILRIFAENSLSNGRSAKTAKEDNVIADKVSQERLKQNSDASFNPGEEDNAGISSFQTFSAPPKHLVHGTDGSDLEDIDHVVSLPTVVKPNENQHGSKSSEEADQKNSVISSHNSTPIQAKEHKNQETSMVKEENCNESSSITGEPEEKNNVVSSHNSTPIQAKEHKNPEISMLKEKSCNESSSISENSLKNLSPSDKCSSNHIEKGNKNRKSSSNAEFENEISPTRCLRKREETSSSSLDEEKKKAKKDSSKQIKKSLSVSKSEQEVSAGKCPKKRKYPTNNNCNHAKKKKAENNFPRSTASFQKRVVKTLRNHKEF